MLTEHPNGSESEETYTLNIVKLLRKQVQLRGTAENANDENFDEQCCVFARRRYAVEKDRVRRDQLPEAQTSSVRQRPRGPETSDNVLGGIN